MEVSDGSGDTRRWPVLPNRDQLGKMATDSLMPIGTLLALCAGGTVLSHVNDAGFWIVNEYFGMTVPQTLRSWTMMKVVTSLVGITCILTFQALFG